MTDRARDDREARTSRELADAIESSWRSRFGYLPVVIEVLLAKLRRGDA